jgi:hypothetical protein
MISSLTSFVQSLGIAAAPAGIVAVLSFLVLSRIFECSTQSKLCFDERELSHFLIPMQFALSP